MATTVRSSHWTASLVILLWVLAIVTPALGATEFTLARLGDMAVPRAAHQATLLARGEVLITGGCGGRCDSTLTSAEFYDPATRTFRPASPMTMPRNSHSAVLLDDDNVLIVGGWSGRIATASAEKFDPASDRFSRVSDMNEARATPVAVKLADGRVLITGGQTSAMVSLATAEIFDPKTGRFSRTGAMQEPRVGHTATLLDDGRVLIAGGRRGRGELLRTAEIFDPATGRFHRTGLLAKIRHKHAAARLPDGRIMLIGGSDARDDRGRYRTTEIFHPATGRFAAGPTLRAARFKLPDAIAVLPSGRIVVAGGAAQPEYFDPVAAEFSPVHGAMPTAQEFATATLLADGAVLVLGGYDEQILTSGEAWLIRPALPGEI